ncbi:MAG TPA: signal peptidase II [Gemmatimonadaceae bacterium]|nr:signal peptidase II [Gemmatimonadaceae bacterium]
MTPAPRETRLFWATAATVIVADIVTKWIAERELLLHQPRQVIGDYLRWTLAYNEGAAFSMSLGPYQRYIFGVFALIALYILWKLLREGQPGDWLRSLAIGLAWGGALGNLIDRVRHPRGVVDFIDVGLDERHRFWVFNVADSGVTVGAILLALVLLREDRAEARARRERSESSAT